MHAGLNSEDGGRTDKLLSDERRCAAVVRIRKIHARPRQLVSFSPGKSTHAGLQGTAGTVGVTVVKDAVPAANGCVRTTRWIKGEAHARHELLVVDSGDSGGNAFVARKQKPCGRVRIHCRLLARRPGIQTVADVGVRSVDFVAQPIREGQFRCQAPLVLRVTRGNPLAQAAVEIATALKKLHRLAQQKAGERVAGGKGRKDKEPIGGDTQQYIDLLAIEFGTELEIVLAARPGKRVVALIVVLIRVLRTGDGITDISVSADDEVGIAEFGRERWLVGETKIAGGL